MSAGSKPSVSDRYRRTDEFDLRAGELRLRQIEWRILTTLDGQRTIGGIAQSAGIPAGEAVDIIARFEALGLVDTPRLTYEEFRTGVTPAPGKAEPSGARPFPLPIIPPIRPIQPDAAEFAGEVPPAPPEPPAAPAPDAAPRVTFSLKRAFATSAPPVDSGDEAPAEPSHAIHAEPEAVED